MIVVELIFLTGLAAAAYGCFWLGAKYGTLRNLWVKVKEMLS